MQKLLVANRGEIAVRIFRACRARRHRDRRRRCPRRARLAAHPRCRRDDRDRVVPRRLRACARRAGDAAPTQCIPATAFSPRAPELAEAVLAAGLTWIGPPPAALRPAATSSRAKETARAAGVPVLPNGTPEEVGYPLLVKAAAGGGGRGMRIVRDAGGAGRRRRGCEAGGRSRVRRRHRVLRALPRAAAARRDPAARRHARRGHRARRARVLDAAAAPEGARGVAVGRARPGAARAHERRGRRVRARDRLRERRHRRVRARRPRLLLPRAERPHPGRASGDRARHRRRSRARAAAHRGRG